MHILRLIRRGWELNEFFAVAATLLIHEVGHAVAALLCGVPVLGIRARAGGLSLLCRADAVSYPRAALIYAGGAAANLMTAVIFSREQPLSVFSVGAAVFNLLPLPGSDGEGILSSLLSFCTASPDIADRVVRSVSDVCVIAIWVAAVYLSLTGRGGALLLMFAIVMMICRLGEREPR